MLSQKKGVGRLYDTNFVSRALTSFLRSSFSMVQQDTCHKRGVRAKNVWLHLCMTPSIQFSAFLYCFLQWQEGFVLKMCVVIYAWLLFKSRNFNISHINSFNVFIAIYEIIIIYVLALHNNIMLCEITKISKKNIFNAFLKGLDRNN